MDKKLLKSFSNVTRLRILICLQNEDKSVNELVEKCKFSQSAVSQHLKILRENKTVITQKKGKKIFYKLQEPLYGVVAFNLYNLLEKK